MTSRNVSGRMAVGPVWRKFFRIGGSLRLATVIMTLLALVCGWGTFVELDFGTPVVSRLIYQSGWFYGLGFLLGLNILFSVLARFPWKRRHLPFLSAHIGILLLLIGCWTTHRATLEGKMTITEGTSQNRAILPNDWELSVEITEKDANGRPVTQTKAIPFDGGPFNGNDYRQDGWRRDVLLPAEKNLPAGDGFFQRLSRFAFRLHYQLTGFLVSLSPPPALGNRPVIDLSDNLRLTLDDYLIHGDYEAVPPMVINLDLREKDGDAPKKETVVFDFSNLDQTAPDVVVSRRGIRKTLPGGERLLFSLADSRREAESFVRLFPTAPPASDDSNDTAETHSSPLFELAFDCGGKITRLPSERVLALNRLNGESSAADDGDAEKTVPLGEGWNLDRLEIVPTLVPGNPLLRGWTARVDLVNETSGETDHLQLSSDWPERDVQGTTSGIFGVLYGYLPNQMKTSPLGKKWDPTIVRPRLEIMESPDGALFYRVWNGQNRFFAGELTASVGDKTENDSVKTAGGETASENGDFQAVLSFRPVEFSSRQTGFVSLTVREFTRQDELGVRLTATPFHKETANEFYAKARLTAVMKAASGEESTESFWIRTIPTGISNEESQIFLRQFTGPDGKRYRFALKNKSFAPGFSLYVKNFKPVYEPGSSTPSSFSSLLDYLPESVKKGENGSATRQASETDKRENVTVRMNHPGVFYSPVRKVHFWAYQDSFRGPFYPGDPVFDRVVVGKTLPGETVPREKLYQTVLSLNSDPGRGLKYFGSFLIVFGTALLILRKKGEFMSKSNGGVRRMPIEKIGAILLAFLFTAEVGNGAELLQAESAATGPPDATTNVTETAPSENLDWTEWRLLPVFDSGRIMPLNSFASIVVKEVCGSTHPVLTVDDSLLTKLEGQQALGLPALEKMTAGRKLTEDQKKGLSAAYDEMNRVKVNQQKRVAERLRQLFPKGKRRFEAHELLFSWIVEPEIWEFVPFIADPGGLVRKKILTDFSASDPVTPTETSDPTHPANPASSTKTAADSPRFLSPAELKASQLYSERIEKIRRRKIGHFTTWDAATEDGRLDRACAVAESRLSRFDALAFYPCWEKTSQTPYYLNQILYPDDTGMTSPGIAKESSLEKLDRSVREIKRILVEKTETASDSPFADPDFYLGETVSVGGEGRRFEVIRLLRDVHEIAGLYDRSPLEANERRLNTLWGKTQTSYERLIAHRNAIFAENRFSPEYRKEVLSVTRLLTEVLDRIGKANLGLYSNGYWTVRRNADKKRILPNETKKTFAYDALPAASLTFTDGGRLAVLPNLTPSLNDTGENAAFVWLPIQTVLFGSEAIWRRSVEGKDSPPIPVGTADADEPSDGVKSGIEPFGFMETLRKRVATQTGVDNTVSSFLLVAEVYLDPATPNRNEKFQAAMKKFSGDLRHLGENGNRLHSEEIVKTSLTNSPIDSTVKSPASSDGDSVSDRKEEINSLSATPEITKSVVAPTLTTYPVAGSLQTEFLYFRLDPFFWLWTLSLGALAAVILSTLLRRRAAAIAFLTGLVLLGLAALVTAIGGGLRAYITGWAPVTNMFETVVLLAFLVMIVTLCYVLQPMIGPPISRSWRLSRLPFNRRQTPNAVFDTANGVSVQAPDHENDGISPAISRFLLIVRLFLTALTLWGTLILCYREHAFDQGIWQTFLDSFAMQGILDRAAILATIILVVWFVPRMTMTAILLFFVGHRPNAPSTGLSSDSLTAGTMLSTAGEKGVMEKKPNGKPTGVFGEIFDRRLFLIVGAFVAFGIGLLAYYNTTEFNPNIRPLTAVLRSNFWLTVHVLAIMFSYALGSIAWILSLIMMANYLFGCYRHEKKPAAADRRNPSSPQAPSSPTVFDPPLCVRLAPAVLKLLQFTVLFLTLGTILGARWADFSWGRFWSWDPKEVWALVTLLIYLTVLHLRKLGDGRVFGLALGGLLGGLSIVMTWYGLSFVFGGGGRHSYAAGETNKTLILYLLIGGNLLFGLAGTVRYLWKKRRDHFDNR